MIHCAGLKAVGESEERPLAYYDVNVGGASRWPRSWAKRAWPRSSSVRPPTVYGQPDDLPVAEDAPLRPQQRLRPHQAHRRGIPARSCARQRELADRDPALFQSGGGALVRHARRGVARTARTISCRCCAGSRRANSPTPISAATGPRPMAPAFATTSTCRTSRRVTLRRSISREDARRDDREPRRGRGHSVLEVVAAFERACGRRIAKTIGRARAGRRRGVLRRSVARDEARLARDARTRRDLRGCWRWQKNGGVLTSANGGRVRWPRDGCGGIAVDLRQREKRGRPFALRVDDFIGSAPITSRCAGSFGSA